MTPYQNFEKPLKGAYQNKSAKWKDLDVPY